MKINRHSASSQIGTLLARVLACVLLVGVISSASVGVVHSHGNVLSGSDAYVRTDITARSGVSSESPLRSGTDESQCLICVLHGQFSSSVVQSPFFIAGLPTPVELVSAAGTFSYSSTFLSSPIERLSGRAPPFCQA